MADRLRARGKVEGVGIEIQGARVHRLAVPLERTLRNGSYEIGSIQYVLLELDGGDAVGIGYAFAFEPHQAESVRAMVNDLVEPLLGRSIEDVEAVGEGLVRRIRYIGRTGPPIIALSAVNTALWDLVAQREGLPLYRIFGGATAAVPVYATGGWLTYSTEEVIEEAQRFSGQGVAGYKMKIGHRDWRTDIERVERVRAAIDNETMLMVDANEAWSVSEAIEAGRALSELGVSWFEEPVAADDVDGCAQVAKAVDVAVAAGESVFGRDSFIPLIERRSADVVMPDLMRCGGPTEFLEVAALADAHQLPVSSHAMTEVSAHLMAACPNASLVEWIPGWSDVLFDQGPSIADGKLSLPQGPGVGVRYSAKAIHDYSVDRLTRSQALVRDWPRQDDGGRSEAPS